MINIVNIILLLCLIGCLLYIYWLHHTFNTDTKKVSPKKNIPNKHSEPADDEISFLKSNYDMSLTTRESESIFADDDNTTSDSHELDLH